MSFNTWLIILYMTEPHEIILYTVDSSSKISLFAFHVKVVILVAWTSNTNESKKNDSLTDHFQSH